MKFEWEENKNQINQAKHGISFEEAKEVFNDPNRKTSPDLRINYGESRWKTIGKIYGFIISVISTPRKAKTRLISARRANTKERSEYDN